MFPTKDAVSPAIREMSAARMSAIWAFIAIVVTLVAPRSTAVWLAVVAAVAIVSGSFEALLAQIKRLPLPAVAALAFCGWSLLNSFWAVDLIDALGKVAALLLIVATVHLGTASLSAVSTERLVAVAYAIVMAFVAGAAYLCIEIVFDQPIKHAVFELLPFLRGSPKHVRIAADGTVAAIPSYLLNRNLAALNLVLWPALALIAALLEHRRALIVGSGVLIVSALAIYLSEHETSMLALPAALLVFVLARASVRWGLALLTVGWGIATLLVIPLAVAAYVNGLHLADWVPETGRSRIVLWSYTVEQWRKVPVLGIGVASTKKIDDVRAAVAVKPDGFTYPLRTGRHAHNVFLQTWYELGIIGGVLLLFLGLAALHSIAALPTSVMPYAMAGFAAAAVMGAFSWGLWQVWFLALFGMSILLTGWAIEVHKRSPGLAACRREAGSRRERA